MSEQFHQYGIRFQYPENWRLEREETDSGWTVHLQSPGTAFLLVSVDSDMPNSEEVLQTIFEAMRGDYPDLEARERIETLAGQPTIGQDMQFTSLDLTNTCRTRSFYTEEATILVLWQATDLEYDEAEPVLEAICASLELDGERP